jgi:vacuolar-type H+-ATPase subunit E/Vma4
MRDNVLALNGNEPPLEVTVDEKKGLPEYNVDTPGNSCTGGVKLHARKGRIVCSNTLDDRLSLCYQETTPQIRRLLFPNY